MPRPLTEAKPAIPVPAPAVQAPIRAEGAAVEPAHDAAPAAMGICAEMDPDGRKVPPGRGETGGKGPVPARQMPRKPVVRLIQLMGAVRPRPPVLGVGLVPEMVRPPGVAEGAPAARSEAAVGRVSPASAPTVRPPRGTSPRRRPEQEVDVRRIAAGETGAAGEAVAAEAAQIEAWWAAWPRKSVCTSWGAEGRRG